jgi:2-dehydro-3-deoxyphosphogluconate aldolase/(4S)-4-hydroxy-2-oxoglutarate aldolase
MNNILEKIGKLRIVPVVKIERAKDAFHLSKALIDGGLPIIEITFRTSAAEESIKILSEECPELLVGAGTVLTAERAKKAVSAGAKFIVLAGFNPKVVDYCIENHVPVTRVSTVRPRWKWPWRKNLKSLNFSPLKYQADYP